MDPGTRRLICHWHVQLADPLYRAFTGRFLPERHERSKPDVTRDLAVAWVGEQVERRWTMSTRIQFGSKLLSSAFAAGLVASNRDPRALQYPRVADEALTYLMYLLREVDFAGTLLDNPYTASVGLSRARARRSAAQVGCTPLPAPGRPDRLRVALRGPMRMGR